MSTSASEQTLVAAALLQQAPSSKWLVSLSELLHMHFVFCSCRYVDVRTQSGFTAVHFAVHHNSQQALAAMLNHGGHMMLSSLFDSLDCINCTKGTTPLHLAARNGNTAIAQQLLKAYVSSSGLLQVSTCEPLHEQQQQLTS